VLFGFFLFTPQIAKFHCHGNEDNGVTTLTFLGSRDVIGHVTIRLAGVDFLCWSIVTMRISSTVMEIYGRLKFFQEGSSRNRVRSLVGPQYYTDLIYSSSLR